MLPLEFPKVDQRWWQQLINNYIWNHKRHRIAQRILRMLHNEGSLGVPNFQIHYEAAYLVNVLRILTSEDELSWVNIETLNLKNLMHKDIFWLTKPERKPLNTDNTYLTPTLKIWNKWKLRLVKRTSLYMPLSCFKWPIDNLKYIIHSWKQVGIITFKDITSRGSLLTKNELEEKTHTNLMWLCYFQIREILSSRLVQEDLKAENTAFEIWLHYKIHHLNTNCQ